MKRNFLLDKFITCLFIVEEAESFNREWQTRTRRVAGAIGAGASSGTAPINYRHQPEPRQLALPSTTNVPRLVFFLN